MRHKVEVDQSNKIEDSGPTYLAFANGINDAVQIPSKVKRTIIELLMDAGRTRSVSRLLVFAAGIYLLLEPYLDQLNQVIIDTEYTGHERRIKGFLLLRIRRSHPKFEAWRIQFGSVGKGPAHDKANEARKKRGRGYRKLDTKRFRDALL